MTDSEWCRSICVVDHVALRKWIADHADENIHTRSVSTKRDNYGITGQKSTHRVNHFEAAKKIAGAVEK